MYKSNFNGYIYLQNLKSFIGKNYIQIMILHCQ